MFAGHSSCKTSTVLYKVSPLRDALLRPGRATPRALPPRREVRLLPYVGRRLRRIANDPAAGVVPRTVLAQRQNPPRTALVGVRYPEVE
jgi:hypothetical protein